MTRISRAAVTVRVRRTHHSGQIEGPVRVIHPLLRALGCPWQYDHRAHYLVPIQHLDDLVADMERRRIVVQDGAQ